MSNILTHKITYVKIKVFLQKSENVDLKMKNELFIHRLLLNIVFTFKDLCLILYIYEFLGQKKKRLARMSLKSKKHTIKCDSGALARPEAIWSVLDFNSDRRGLPFWAGLVELPGLGGKPREERNYCP